MTALVAVACSPSAAEIRWAHTLPLLLITIPFALPGPVRAVEDQRSLPLCQVLDGASSSVQDLGPVIRNADLTHDPTSPSRIATVGYGVDRHDYAGSADTEWNLVFATRRRSGCPTKLRLRIYGVQGGSWGGPILMERITSVADVAGRDSHRTVSLLIADLPGGDSTGSGPCLAAEVVLTDPAGDVVQVAPTSGPLVTCPGAGGEATFGG